MTFKPISSLAIWSKVFPRDFLTALDKNFGLLNTVPAPMDLSRDYTFRQDDQIDSVQADATVAALVIYLPESPTGGRRRRVIKTDSSANTVTVNGNGNLINGASTYVLVSQYDRIEVEPTGTGWLIVS